MSETTNGTVLAVATVTLGDELAADFAAGSTSIAITDAADFAESGGTLSINGQLVDYSACDDASGTINLVDPLAGDAAAGDPVYLADPAGKLASELRATVQAIGSLDSDEPIEAVIAHPIVPLLPEGIRDPGTGESVTLELLPGEEWQLVNVHGRKPEFDSDNSNAAKVVTGAQDDASQVSISSTVSGPGNSSTSGFAAVAIGDGASAAWDTSIAAGVDAAASASGATAVGASASASGTSSAAVGAGSAATGASSVAIGASSEASADGAIALGEFADASAAGAVAVGGGAHDANSTSVGTGAVAGGANSLALGADAGTNGDGAVAIGCDSTGTAAAATSADDFMLGTANHHVQVPGRLNVARRTPSGTADTQGSVGDITSDDSYVYVKTSAGWKRAALSTF